MDKQQLGKLISKYSDINQNTPGKHFWQPWGIYLEPIILDELSKLLIEEFNEEIRNSDFLCAIPNSGLPLAVNIHVLIKKPLLIVDFSNNSLYAIPDNIASPLNVFVIDTSVNSGGTITQSYSILHRKLTIGKTVFAVVVLNDFMPRDQVLPFCYKLVSNGKLKSLYKLSELVKT